MFEGAPEIVIQGITESGETFRPSDWSERLAGVPGVLEVSIGHALIADALELGYTATVKDYLSCIDAALGPFLRMRDDRPIVLR